MDEVRTLQQAASHTQLSNDHDVWLTHGVRITPPAIFITSVSEKLIHMSPSFGYGNLSALQG
jgi:hypothetical protein